jgi:peptidoglycan/xylan/chitin deacetylase (PgdA/CDA1 family)
MSLLKEWVIGIGGSGSNYSVDLPQQLITTPAVYTEEFDATTGWTAEGSTTMALNTTQFHSGTGSIKLTSASGAVTGMNRVVHWNLTTGNGFNLWVYAHSNPAPSTALAINTWTMLHLWPSLGAWEVGAGNPSWSDINYLRIKVNTVSGQISILSFDLAEIGKVKQPAVMISFDGAYTNQYAVLQTMKARKMVGTLYVQSAEVGNVGRLTSAQLVELNSSGHDIANHTMTHTNLTTLTQQQCQDEFTGCKSYLDGIGLTRASSHIAYPAGYYNATVLAAMAASGMKTGRLADNSAQSWNYYESGVLYLGYPFKLNSRRPANTDALSVITGWIDYAVAISAVCNIYIHQIVESPSIADEWSIANFNGLLDYIESLGLQTLTIDEYYRLYSGAITVNHK